MSILEKIWEKSILLIFILFLAFLSGLSLMQYALMTFDFHIEQTDLIDRSPIFTLVVSFIVFAVLAVLLYITRRVNVRVIAAFTFVYFLLMGFIWITMNDYPATWDQISVWEGAINSPEELKSNIYYYTYNAHQAGMTWVMRNFMHIFRTENVMSWRIMNVIVMAGTAVCLVLFAGYMYAGAASVTAVILMIFLPAVLYTSFVYGTVLSLALVTYSMFCCNRFFCGGSSLWLLGPVLMIPLANLTYSGTYVATIAVCLSLLSYSVFTRSEREDNKVKRRIIPVVAIIFIVFLTVFGTAYAKRNIFHSFGINEIPKGKPAVAYAYMGITSEGEVACGPGSYSWTADNLYSTYGEEASGPAKELLFEAIHEYITGERSFGFFVEKTKYQWLDPTFGSIVMTCYFDWLECSPEFYNFLIGGIPKLYTLTVLKYLVPFVYMLALIGGVAALTKGKLCYVERMICILFIGGFMFQLIWESKARYCYPYFMFLIPMAACGIGELYTMACRLLPFDKKMHCTN